MWPYTLSFELDKLPAGEGGNYFLCEKVKKL